MLAQCENCGQTRELPAYLWYQVIYNVREGVPSKVVRQRSKTVCPACYEWARTHPEEAQVID